MKIIIAILALSLNLVIAAEPQLTKKEVVCKIHNWINIEETIMRKDPPPPFEMEGAGLEKYQAWVNKNSHAYRDAIKPFEKYIWSRINSVSDDDYNLEPGAGNLSIAANNTFACYSGDHHNTDYCKKAREYLFEYPAMSIAAALP